MIVVLSILFFFFKQKTAYEMRISDWSSDVCSSDLPFLEVVVEAVLRLAGLQVEETKHQRTGEAHQRGREGNAHAAERMFQPALPLLEQAVDVVAAEIGRASCRERVCQYGEILVVAEALKKQKNPNNILK